MTSSINPILKPILDNALIAACAPGPGLFGPLCPPGALILMCNPLIPFSFTISASFFKGVEVNNLNDLKIIQVQPFILQEGSKVLCKNCVRKLKLSDIPEN